MLMDTNAYLDTIERDADAFAAAARKTDLDATVPACPEWDVADLVHHLGEVHRFWAENVRSEALEPPDMDIGRPEDDDLVAWFEDGVDDLLDVLQATEDDDTEVWTWWDDNRVGRVKRRMAVETAIHRWDIEAAATGDPDPIGAQLAQEGIREYIDVLLPAREDPWPHEHATVHLHRTDGRGNWQFTLDSGGGERRWARDDAAVIRATASDILLLLWGRLGADDVTVTGDRQTVRHLAEWAS